MRHFRLAALVIAVSVALFGVASAEADQQRWVREYTPVVDGDPEEPNATYHTPNSATATDAVSRRVPVVQSLPASDLRTRSPQGHGNGNGSARILRFLEFMRRVLGL
jgi:hypothetical protein